ncbi:MAG TPA: protein kinase [Terriglobales bacterium]|jgi:serine/threonine protein kinase|nr:protein kinase [Terriglobales bacterium]
MSEEAAKRIGDYEILGVLGSGGMGKVFKVRNVISDRIEAMKILLPDLAGRQDLGDRFLREIKVLAGLNHPNIAALRTALTLDNQLVMVMEYVEGETLATRLERGAISAADAVNYIDQVLGALSYAHQQHVIHRDIKPANMMLTPAGIVKLMDFGIARSGTERGLTMTGTTMGSLYYMSPEQVKGQPTDARSDLYSVGVSLYEMVTGERPFRADSDYSLMAAHLQQPPKPPIEVRADLPPALNEIILMAIAKEPAQRFQSADAFRNALNSVRGAMPATPSANKTAAAAGISAASATALLQNAGPPASIHEGTTAPLIATPQQPQPIPSVLELSAQQKSHRGLYMSLGALVVLAVLVVAGVYIPRRAKTSANEQANASQEGKPATTQPDSTNSGNAAGADASKAQPTDSAGSDSHNPDTANPLPTNQATQSSSDAQSSMPSGDAGGTGTAPDVKQTDQTQQPPSPDSAKPDKKHGPHRNPKVVTPAIAQGTQEVAAQNSQSLPATSDQLDVLGQQADQLSSQANSVNDSLDNLRRQQSAQGLGLRGDIATAQELMKTHMAKAQAALQNRDAAGAKKYLDLAEGDVARLDKFLGR